MAALALCPTILPDVEWWQNIPKVVNLIQKYSCRSVCFAMDQIIILHAHRWELLVLLHSAWHFHDHSSLLHLTVCLLLFLPASPHSGDMSPSRERVSSEETSTCQKKFTSSPSCLSSPSNPSVSHISSLPGTHHSSFPLLPSSSCHLIQITELACVSFVCRPILPGRWTGGEKTDSHRGMRVCVYEMEGEKEREEKCRNFSWR